MAVVDGSVDVELLLMLGKDPRRDLPTLILTVA